MKNFGFSLMLGDVTALKNKKINYYILQKSLKYSQGKKNKMKGCKHASLSRRKRKSMTVIQLIL